jgi:hypothetical protein
MKMPFITKKTAGVIGLGMALALGCSTQAPSASESNRQQSKGWEDAGQTLPGDRLMVELSVTSRTWVDLGRLEVHRADGDGGGEPDRWDIAFDGWDVYTNSGPSGAGGGAAFGPLDELSFLFDTVPEVPFLREDTTGGAFLDWYAYDGASHQLWSRHHVFGVRRGEQFYKVQLLGYYGEVAGAPVSALYRLRYAAVSDDGAEQVVEVVDLDATAGYPDISDDAPSGCLNLETAELLSLTQAQARGSKGWDLCFRRDAVSINGEEGGPGETAAVDLDANESATLDEIKERTAEGSFEAFDAVDLAALSDPILRYRGDHVVSAFEGSWVENPGENASEGDDAVWLVRGGDGESFFLFTVIEVEGNANAALRATLQIKHLGQR